MSKSKPQIAFYGQKEAILKHDFVKKEKRVLLLQSFQKKLNIK